MPVHPIGSLTYSDLYDLVTFLQPGKADAFLAARRAFPPARVDRLLSLYRYHGGPPGEAGDTLEEVVLRQVYTDWLKQQGQVSPDPRGEEAFARLLVQLRTRFGACDVAGLMAARDQLVSQGLRPQDVHSFPLPGLLEALDRPTADTIVYLGQRTYRIGDATAVEVTDGEHAVLQAFLDCPALSEADLARKTNDEAAGRLLRALCTPQKYGGVFARAITPPGRRGQGGYRVRIRRS